MNITKLGFLSEHFILRISSLLKITNIEFKKNRHSFPECHKNIISIQYAHYYTTCSGPHSKKTVRVSLLNMNISPRAQAHLDVSVT